MIVQMYDENNIQALSAIKAVTGVTMRLAPLDQIDRLVPTDDGIDVWLTTYRVEERKAELRITGRGAKLVQISKRGSFYQAVESRQGWGQWYLTQTTAWDVEQCGEGMADAIRNSDMDTAQFWMRMQTALEQMGDFTPFNIPHYGTHQSASEWADKVRRERMAGRAGTSSHPMDTWERTQAGHTSDRMMKHWNRT